MRVEYVNQNGGFSLSLYSLKMRGLLLDVAGATRLPAAGSNVVCSSQSLQLPVRKELTASTSKVSLRRRERLGGLPIKLVASVLSSASMVSILLMDDLFFGGENTSLCWCLL